MNRLWSTRPLKTITVPKQRRIDGDQHVRSIGEELQLLECDFENVEHRHFSGHKSESIIKIFPKRTTLFTGSRLSVPTLEAEVLKNMRR